jgi:hypothetical protein
MPVADTPLSCQDWAELIGIPPTKATETVRAWKRSWDAMVAAAKASTKSGRPDRVAAHLESVLDIANAVRTRHPEAFAQMLAARLAESD